jgi:hypothetical protein
MRRGQPVLHQFVKLVRLVHQLVRFGLGGHLGVHIVDDVPFAPAGVKVVGQGDGFRTERQGDGFKGNFLVPCACTDPISRTRDGDRMKVEDYYVQKRRLSSFEIFPLHSHGRPYIRKLRAAAVGL